MIALIDYGAGNVRSVHKALVAVGAEVIRTASPEAVLAADKVVLPGVGAFAIVCGAWRDWIWLPRSAPWWRVTHPFSASVSASSAFSTMARNWVGMLA